MPHARTRLLIAGALASAIALSGVLFLAPTALASDIAPAPINTVVGNGVDLSGEGGLAVGADGTLYLSNPTYATVSVYAPGAIGNATPEFTLTGFEAPRGLAIDPSGNLWVVDEDADSLLEFQPGENGSDAPIREITGNSTEMSDPADLAFDSAGRIYVTNTGPDAKVLVFAKNATADAKPIRAISGPLTGFTDSDLPYGVALESDGSLVITAQPGGTSALEVFAPNANGNVKPQRTIVGSNTQLDGDFGVAIDKSGIIYASNVEDDSPNVGTITAYAPGASGNAAPISRIVGAPTGLNDPTQLTVDSHGNIWVLNTFPVSALNQFNGAPDSVTEYSPSLAIAAVTPSRGSPAGGHRVTISGTAFTPDAAVTFGGVSAADVVVVSSNAITAVVPAHAVGSVDVTVSENRGADTFTAAGAYTYVDSLPTTGVDPRPVLGAGLILLLLGGVFLSARRRSKSAPQPRGSR